MDPRIEELFHATLECEPPERERFLREACAGDAELFTQVMARVTAYERNPGFLEDAAFDLGVLASELDRKLAGEQDPPVAPPDSTSTQTAEGGGTVSPGMPTIPGFMVRRELGRGGMGVVYEAEQDHPRRPVALKVVRPGLLGAPIDEHHLRLFRREEQTLARLKHPCIAAIYEAGRTEDGQHFFAMELVRGIPLNEYIRTQQVPMKTRLGLFHKICQAINYAHQRGVIHRDLKPSNILIDAEGTPKILDFGLAKITDADVAATTMVTEIGKIQGTLPYMSPEQARGNPDEIDLRSDVYSLGVILYELLAEQLPYDVGRRALPEAVRVICEEPPRKPSTVSRTLRGDVETIALKALQKEPSRRYQNVSSLADDVERYLTDQPILARPPSALYQFKKLVVRHKAPFALMAALFLVVTGFSVWMSVLYVRAVNAEKQAAAEAETAKQVSDFMVGLFELADPAKARGETVTAREILDAGVVKIQDELADQPEVRTTLIGTMGLVYQNLGLYDAALPLMQRTLDSIRRLYDHESATMAVWVTNLANLHLTRGEHAAAEPLFREALAILRKVYGDEHPEVATGLDNLAAPLVGKGALSEAETLRRRALAIRRRLLPDNHPDVITGVNNLATVLHSKGNHEEAAVLFREVLAGLRKLHGEEHPHVATALANLASALDGQGKSAEAETLQRQSVALHEKLQGHDHPATLGSRRQLAGVLLHQGKLSEAEAVLRETLDTHRRVRPERRSEIAGFLVFLGVVLLEQGKCAEAEPLLRECVEIRQAVLPPEHWLTPNTRSILAESLTGQGRYPEAEPLLLDAYEKMSDNPQILPIRIQEVLQRIVKLYDAWGKPDKAAEYRAMLSADESAAPSDR